MAVSIGGRLCARLGYGRSPSPRWWAFLERGSFAAYLFHQQVVQLVLYFLNVPAVPPAALAALCFAASLAVSLAMYAVLGRFRATRFLIGG